MSKLGTLACALPVGLHQIMIRFIGLAAQRGDHFERGLAAIKRRDQRLDKTNRAVESANIAPGFQIVRFGNIPHALQRGLVGIKAEISFPSDLLQRCRRNPNPRERCKPGCRRG